MKNVSLCALLLVALGGPAGANGARAVPPPVIDEHSQQATETAIFAGGCFWGVQGVFQHVKGVTNATSGYTGGDAATAQYETVSSGETGHAESVEVKFDPTKISYGHLMQIYFSVIHDPTELNRQGPDSGTQYRSTVFPMSEDQAKVATAYIEQLNLSHAFDVAIVTTVERGKTFYPAETYHQNFLTMHPDYPYIVFNDLPKIEELHRLFATDYRQDPVLVAIAN